MAVPAVASLPPLLLPPALRILLPVRSRIAAGGGHCQPFEVMRPALFVTDAFLGIRQAAMGHAQQRATPRSIRSISIRLEPGGVLSRPSQPKL